MRGKLDIPTEVGMRTWEADDTGFRGCFLSGDKNPCKPA